MSRRSRHPAHHHRGRKANGWSSTAAPGRVPIDIHARTAPSHKSINTRRSRLAPGCRKTPNRHAQRPPPAYTGRGPLIIKLPHGRQIPCRYPGPWPSHLIPFIITFFVYVSEAVAGGLEPPSGLSLARATRATRVDAWGMHPTTRQRGRGSIGTRKLEGAPVFFYLWGQWFAHGG